MPLPRPSIQLLSAFTLASLFLFSISARAEEKPVGAGDPTKLIEQLRHDEFDMRRSAAEKLLAMGETARTALERASGSEELEIRQAAEALLQKLDKSTIALLAFDRDGKPASGAEAEVKVYAQSSTGVNWNEPRSETVTITPSGEVRLPEQPPGQIGMQFTWKKWAPAREGSAYWGIQLDRGNNPFLFTLTRGGTLKAAIKDEAGKPIKDASVYFYVNRKFDAELLDLQLACSENWDRNILTGTADAKGEVKYEGLADGAYQMVVKASEFYTALGPTFRIHEGQTVDAGAITLQARKNGKLKFALKKSDDTPLKKTRLSVTLEYQFDGPRAVELQRLARQLRSQMNMQRQLESPETDDDGRITLEEQRPGKYKLTVAPHSDTAWESASIKIEPGETVDLATLPTVKTGSVKGKILSADGKGMQYCQVFAIPEEESIDYDDNEPIMDWRFVHQQFNGRSSIQSGADGSYEIKTLRPGRYALSISTRTGQPVIIYGIDVKAGETTAAPEAVTPTPIFSNTSQNMKGTVLLPDGKPAVGASVGMVSGFSRWGRNCDEKGVFEFTVSDQWMPNRIIIKAGDCKPYILELTAPATQLKDLTVRLEKQDYGDLEFKVTDEAGKPLKNVIIRPATGPNRNNYNRTTVERKAVTNKDGLARLTGLASGLRRFTFEREDYYFDGEFKANVIPEKETEVTVALKPGLTLRGQVEMPAGFGFEKSIVFLMDSRSRVVEPDKNGKFEFSGLAPGDYFISAHAPGLISQGRTKVTLPSPAGELQRVKLDKAYGAAIDLKEGTREYTATLVPRGSWDPNKSQDVNVYFNSIASSIDQAGRAEFWGIAAKGEYELVLTPVHQPYSSYRHMNSGSKKLTATLVAGAVKTQPLQTAAEMSSVVATPIDLHAATGSVGGRLVCEPAIGNASTNYGSLSLKIVGATAYGHMTFAYPNEFFQQDARTPLFFGTPPEGMRKPTEFGNFLMSGMPPGEYKVYVDITAYNYTNVPRATAPEPKPTPAPIATFTLKAGEKLSLGKLKFQVPAKVIADIKSGGGGQNDGEPEDRIQIFQP